MREAWKQQQFPPLPQQTAQQSEQLQELKARMEKVPVEDKMDSDSELLEAQGQTSAPAAATPAQGEGKESERALEQKVQDLEGQVKKLPTSQEKNQPQYFDY